MKIFNTQKNRIYWRIGYFERYVHITRTRPKVEGCWNSTYTTTWGRGKVKTLRVCFRFEKIKKNCNVFNLNCLIILQSMKNQLNQIKSNQRDHEECRSPKLLWNKFKPIDLNEKNFVWICFRFLRKRRQTVHLLQFQPQLN